MNLRVQREDGRIETITIVGPAQVHHGEKMHHIHSADGMDHWFLLDGHYDGWGTAVGVSGLADSQIGCAAMIDGEAVMILNEKLPAEAQEAIARVERERRIEDPT